MLNCNNTNIAFCSILPIVKLIFLHKFQNWRYHEKKMLRMSHKIITKNSLLKSCISPENRPTHHTPNNVNKATEFNLK